MSFRKKLTDETATGYKYVPLSKIIADNRKKRGLKKGEKWTPHLSSEQPELRADVEFSEDRVRPALSGYEGTKKLAVVWRRLDGKRLDRPTTMYMTFVPLPLPPRIDKNLVPHMFGCHGMDEFRRFRKAVRDGKVFLRPKLALDTDGRTYVHVEEDLIAPLSGKFKSIHDLLEHLGY